MSRKLGLTQGFAKDIPPHAIGDSILSEKELPISYQHRAIDGTLHIKKLGQKRVWELRYLDLGLVGYVNQADLRSWYKVSLWFYNGTSWFSVVLDDYTIRKRRKYIEVALVLEQV